MYIFIITPRSGTVSPLKCRPPKWLLTTSVSARIDGSTTQHTAHHTLHTLHTLHNVRHSAAEEPLARYPRRGRQGRLWSGSDDMVGRQTRRHIHLGALIQSLALSYDAIAAVALVRAAERAKSPAILQIFPVTMREFVLLIEDMWRALTLGRAHLVNRLGWQAIPSFPSKPRPLSIRPYLSSSRPRNYRRRHRYRLVIRRAGRAIRLYYGRRFPRRHRRGKFGSCE
jgi:hypothetical protein